MFLYKRAKRKIVIKAPVFFIFVRKRKKDEDRIQLWCRIAKTEYSDPLDTGYLSFCGQLSD